MFEVIRARASQYFWFDPEDYGNRPQKNCLHWLILIALDTRHIARAVSIPENFVMYTLEINLPLYLFMWRTINIVLFNTERKFPS